MGGKQASIHTRLAQARRKLFVGRSREMALFDQLVSPNGDLRVLYLHGGGGLGKTTLVNQYADLAQGQGLPVVYVDARFIDPTPQALAAAIDEVCTTQGVDYQEPYLVILDTFELLAAMEDWLRETWLPRQPDTLRLVIAGRCEPSIAWRTDLKWSTSFLQQEVEYFGREDAEEYLKRRGLEGRILANAADFGQGHPLALALFADAVAAGNVSDLDEFKPNRLLADLLARLLGNISDPLQRQALYACAIVRTLEEPLLAEMCELQNVHDLFDWLRGHNFIQSGRQGIFPHDLVREALVADIKQRDLTLYHHMGERAYNWYLKRIETRESDSFARIQDAFYLLRDLTLPTQMGGPETEEASFIDAASKTDWPDIERMVLQYEGPESLKVLTTLAQAQPSALHVVRGKDLSPIGFFLLLHLRELPTEVIEQDPLCASFIAHCRQLGGGDNITANFLRFWMHRDLYMQLSAIHPMIFAQLVFDATTLGQQYSATVQLDDNVWNGLANIVEHNRLTGSEREMAGGPTVVMYQDFTRQSPLQWLQKFYRRVQGLPPLPEPSETSTEAIELDEETVEKAIHLAFKHYHRPDRLTNNPLLTSPLLARDSKATNTPAPIEALQSLVQEETQKLRENPKSEPIARALQHAYLEPAANQDLAAEAANMAPSTFRRRLKEGVQLISARLMANSG